MTVNANPNLANLYIGEITLYCLLRTFRGFESLLCTRPLVSDQRTNQFSQSRAQLNWVSSGLPIPLINGSGSKCEDNSTELSNM